MWLADRHSDQELYTAAKHCAKIHLAQLHQTEEFLNLPLCLLLDIIKGIPVPCSVAMWLSKPDKDYARLPHIKLQGLPLPCLHKLQVIP